MVSINELIDTITINPDNLREIIQSGKVSGELKAEINRIVEEYVRQN